MTYYQKPAQTAFSQVVQSLQRHPKRLVAAIAAALLTMGGAAFAVASLEANSSDVVVQQILENLALPQNVPAKQALAALPAAPLTLFQTTTTRANDTADTLLKRLGVFDSAAAAYLRSHPDLHQTLLGRAGRVVSVQANGSREMQKLTARWVNADTDEAFQRLTIERSADGTKTFASRAEVLPLVPVQALGSATISSSLFAATDEANIPDAVAVQLAEIFSGQVDFHRSLRKGDRLSVVYEDLQADGESIRSGKVLSAEFVNNGKSNQAIWFKDTSASKGSYYSFDGNSLKKAFLASPLEFTRMSSGYGIRVHPITQDKRAHKGIDYAAPTGTPIRSVGDGVVEFAGVQRGYGNVIEIKHRSDMTTVFAHLSRIGVQKGQKVEQGDLIGAVGSTGFSTGPHLHFEFRVDGEHRDPSTLVAEGGGAAPLSAATKPVFEKTSAFMRGQLAQADSVRLASAQ